MLSKRLKYYTELRTTYPINVNGKQPQNYGNQDLVIDYSSLKKPDLEDLEKENMQLI